jgi:glycosyltransferase involved in cell wall biosynthesis
MMLRPALRALLNRPRSAVLVQNRDDRALVEKLGVGAERIALIPGSGVDIEALKSLPEPDGPVTIAFVGRLVGSKGIRALVEAHARLIASGQEIRLLIAGLPDPANPTAIGADEIARWQRQTHVSYVGLSKMSPRYGHVPTLPCCRHIGRDCP